MTGPLMPSSLQLPLVQQRWHNSSVSASEIRLSSLINGLVFILKLVNTKRLLLRNLLPTWSFSSVKTNLKRKLQAFIETRLQRHEQRVHNSLIGGNPFKCETVCRARATRDMCDFNLFLSKAGYEQLNNTMLTKFENEHFPYFQDYDGGWIAKGGTYYAFTNEIPVNSEIEIRTSIGGWNDKWMYLVSRFISYPSPNDLPRSSHTHSKRSSGSFSFASVPWIGVPVPAESLLHCTAITRVEFKTDRMSIPSNLVLAASGYGISPALFEKIQNRRFDECGKDMKELYSSEWRITPLQERWWDKAFHGEVELRRAEASRTLTTLVYTIPAYNRYSSFL